MAKDGKGGRRAKNGPTGKGGVLALPPAQENKLMTNSDGFIVNGNSFKRTALRADYDFTELSKKSNTQVSITSSFIDGAFTVSDVKKVVTGGVTGYEMSLINNRTGAKREFYLSPAEVGTDVIISRWDK